MAKSEERVSGRRWAREHKSGFGNNTVKVPNGYELFAVKAAGTKRLEILPYRVGQGNPNADPGMLHFERTFWVHRDVGAEEEQYICLRKTFGRKCPVCEEAAAMRRNPEADKEVLKALEPRERQLWAIFDLDDQEKGVQLWDVSYHLFGKALKARIEDSDEEDGYEFFSDPKTGSTLRVGFHEKTFAGNKFYEVQTIDFKPRKAAISAELLKAVPCLDDLIIQMEYDKLRAIFLQLGGPDGGTGEGDSGDDAPQAPQQGQRRQQAAQAAPEPDPEPPAQQQPAQAATGGAPTYEVGANVQHREYGICEVLAIKPDGTALKLEGKDGTIYKNVPASDVRPPKAKQQQAPPPPPPAADGDDWDEAPPPAKAAQSPKQQQAATPAAEAPKQPAQAPAKGSDEWDDWEDAPPPKQKK